MRRRSTSMRQRARLTLVQRAVARLAMGTPHQRTELFNGSPGDVRAAGEAPNWQYRVLTTLEASGLITRTRHGRIILYDHVATPDAKAELLRLSKDKRALALLIAGPQDDEDVDEEAMFLPEAEDGDEDQMLDVAASESVDEDDDGEAPAPADANDASVNLGVEDAFSRFVAECLVVDPTSRVPLPPMKDAYVRWCSDRYVVPANRQEMNRQLLARGLRRMRLDGPDRQRCWQGVRLAGAGVQDTSEAAAAEQTPRAVPAARVYTMEEKVDMLVMLIPQIVESLHAVVATQKKLEGIYAGLLKEWRGNV